MLDRLETDAIKIDQDYYINTGNSQIILKQSSSILASISADSNLLSQQQVMKIVSLVDNILYSKIVEGLISEDNQLFEDLLTTISNINLYHHQELSNRNLEEDLNTSELRSKMDVYIKTLKNLKCKTMPINT